MTQEMREKLSMFIDDLIEYKFEHLVFDIFTDKRKKFDYYCFDLDSGIIIKNSTNPLLTQMVHFAVCTQSGLVVLSKDDYDEFRIHDNDFANKYAKIIEECNNRKLLNNLESIIDTTYRELKLNRQQNIKKLLG